MFAGRIFLVALFFAFAIVLSVPQRACAQMNPDFPTGGTNLHANHDPDRPQTGAATQASLATLLTRIRSGALVYGWFAPAIQRSVMSPSYAKGGLRRLAR